MQQPDRTIRIAAALIDDGAGRLLLVRKAGTRFFMQAGGKMEAGETALGALRRELDEEIGLLIPDGVRYLGRFSAAAANEADCVVLAELFHVRTQHRPVQRAEIEEALWLTPDDARTLPLAPLTRNHVLPLAEALARIDPEPASLGS